MKPDDKFDSHLAELLDSLIAARQAGQDPAKLIAHLPAEQQAELLALCDAAMRTAALTRLDPSAAAETNTLSRIERAAGATSHPFRRVLAWAASIVLVVALASGVSFAIAESSIPGELLYPVKRASENVRMFLIRDAEGRAEFCVCISERRLQELIATARANSVNPSIVNAMLSATRRAYCEAEALPADARGEMRARVGHACGYQGDALKALQSWIPEKDTILISAAIMECKQRWESCCGGRCWCVPGECD